MYCSGCGTELEAGLNFCKRCGSRVAPERTSAVAENLASSLSYIGGFGLIGFVALIYTLLRSPTPYGDKTVPIALMYLATLFGIAYLILRQTAPFTFGGQRKHVPEVAPDYLKPATTAQLTSSSEPPASVTDHTTRTLDESRARVRR